MQRVIRHWLTGIRTYIALFSVLISGLVIWWAHATYGNSPTATIRMQEIFAWLALSLLVLAMSISPLFKLYPSLWGKRIWFEARRLIGISAAWFATLHVSIAYAAQFKLANPLSLPGNYRVAFTLGGVALLILLSMAFTSFDNAFKMMGIWWYRLHRLVYVAFILTVFHVFMIGTHAAQIGVIIGIGAVSAALLIAHIAITFHAKRAHKSVTLQIISIICVTFAITTAIIYGFHQRTNHNLALSDYGATQK